MCKPVGLVLALYGSLLVALSLPHSALAASVPPWLYSVEVPVANQSAAERERASGEALLGLLSRLTGLASIPRNEVVRDALANTSVYYSEFNFAQDAERNPLLVITFARQPVLSLVKRAQLPIWLTRRPVILALVALTEQNQATILDEQSRHPLVAAVKAHGRKLGLEVRFPPQALDLPVDVEDLQRNRHDLVLGLPELYGADLALLGNVSSRVTFRGRDLRGQWSHWSDQQLQVAEIRTDRFEEAAATGLDAIANRLIAENTVLDRGQNQFNLTVRGIDGVAAYRDMLNYLRQLEYIDRVTVARLQPETLHLAVETRAQPEQLLAFLSADGRLQE
ncbi:MAG: DUF2066 domain-containing protein, partial [Pseudomonadota bacterium]